MVISKRIKPFIPLIFSLLLALVLFFLVNDFIGTVILRPLLYVLWFVSLIAESIPQGVIWAIFILLFLIVAYASLKKGESENPPLSQLPARNTGQVEKWARLLGHAQNDKFTKWRLASELKRLTRRLLSPDGDRKDRHDQVDLDLPTEISAFFESQQPTITPFWQWLNKERKDETETALDLDPEVVIQYLEKQLRP